MPLPSAVLRRSRWALPLALLVAAAACDYGAVRIVDPPAPQPRALSLLMLPDSEALVAARALGWERGIPDVDVTLSRDSESGAQQLTGRSSASGVATIQQASGQYASQASRWLSPTELARLASVDPDIVGFVAGGDVDASGAGQATLQLRPSRKRGLVISEWAFNPNYVVGVADYRFGGFLELYNNSDTTVFLDRMVLGEAYSLASATPYATCAQQISFKRDPRYIWARQLYQMPGAGREYPLGPGSISVVATDAIDHRPIMANTLDLSDADFEFQGTADVDNPSVPNVTNIGTGNDPFGHGFTAQILASAFFIATPLDLTALPSQLHVREDSPYRGIPLAQVLDAIALQSDYVYSTEYCGDQLHSNFDRGTGRYMRSSGTANDAVRSVERRLATVLGNGRRVLQHTRTTKLDFFVGTRTPGLLP